MAPTPPGQRPTGGDRDPNRSQFHDRFGASGPNPVAPPVAKPPPRFDANDDDFDRHTAPAEPPRKYPPRRTIIAVGGVTAGVLLLCGGWGAVQAVSSPEPRVTFTVTHVPEPSTTTATETQTQTQTQTRTATKTVKPTKKKRSRR